MALPQIVTLRDVLISGRKAINAKTLQAMNPDACDEADAGCCNMFLYKGQEIRCIIGSALNDEVINKLTQDNDLMWGIGMLAGDYIVVPNAEDKEQMHVLQDLHDSAVTAINPEIYKERYSRFIRHFERLEKVHGTNNHA